MASTRLSWRFSERARRPAPLNRRDFWTTPLRRKSVLSHLWQLYVVAILLLALNLAVRGLRRGWHAALGRRDISLGVGMLGLAAAQLIPLPHSVFIEIVVFVTNCTSIYAFVTASRVGE
jgi:hypothetical protein